MQSPATDLETRRRTATVGLDAGHRSKLGQYFTPEPVADFMASLIDDDGGALRLLDAGAGIGLLSAAVLGRRPGRCSVHAWELEPHFLPELRATLALHPGSHEIHSRDFILDAVERACTGRIPGYDAAILNPPYAKIATGSVHRRMIEKLGFPTVNLYSCFLGCAVALCRPGAQIVAIIPRSWMNGPYFRAFRHWLLEHAALVRIHLFDRRDQAFSDDDVLQENVIVKLEVAGQQGEVRVSRSLDARFTDFASRTVPFSDIVTPGDPDLFIHVPAAGGAATNLQGQPLRAIGLDVCTGPVVDFRLRDHLHDQPVPGTAPLLYAAHFASGRLEWPRASRKPNAIAVNDQTRSWLMPNGCYVLTRRLTSKEEKRRIVAYLLPADALPGPWIGFENHLNVIHQDRHGLDPAVARGLVRYLNSAAVDDYFRTFSGHTQVNATDLRRLNYPTQQALRESGAKDEAAGS